MASDGSRKDKLTYMFLLDSQFPIQKEDSPSLFERWYRFNKDYLPGDLRDLKMNSHNYFKHTKDKVSVELFIEFNQWYYSMKSKVELALTQRYMTGGAKRYLDVLERRYRQNWGVQKETTIETKKDADSEGITIKFVEA